MNDILIWRSADRLVASFLNDEAKLHAVEATASVRSSLGDYDYIINKGQLVGFAFAVTQRDIAEMDPLINSIENIKFDPLRNEMRIILAGEIDGPLDVKCVQASSVVYWAKGKPVGIGLSKWTDWGSIGFPMV